jgi:xylulokinase
MIYIAYIGIDLGTTNLKVLLFSLKHGVVDFEKVKLSSKSFKEGFHEQNPYKWVEQTFFLMNKILKRNVSYFPKIKAIGFSGQMHGLIAIDNNGKVVRPCMTWMDQRAKEEAKLISEKVDIFSITGNLANPSFTLPKILWLKNNEKENYKKSSSFFQPKDFLRYFFGKNKALVTDKTDASATLLMDIKNQNWSHDILNAFDIDSQKLPKIKNSYEIVDYLDDEISREIGLNKNIPLIVGAGDQEAAAVGLGVLDEDEAFLSCGTAAQIFRPTKQLALDKNAGVHLFCHPFTGWHYLGAIQNAGNVLEWALKTLDFDYRRIEQIDMKKPNSLYFLPYLTGERTPIMDQDAKGVWMGLSISHSKEDMIRSVLEGISFSIKLAYEKIKDILGEEDICYLIGGATKSKLWPQMITDVIEKELQTVSIYEGSAYGAALLAAIGCGDIAENDLHKFKPQLNKLFYPNYQNKSYYQSKYQNFLKLIELEKNFRNFL